MSDPQKNKKTRLILLALGAMTGLILAATGLIESGLSTDDSLPTTIIARVGDRNIPVERYRELMRDLEADKRTPLTDEDRKFVLDRLIDEELLVLRGIEMGLAENAPQIRKAIASVVIAQSAAETEAIEADAATLMAFYASDPEFFTKPGRYQVRWWRLAGSDADAELKAAKALELLQLNTSPVAVESLTGMRRINILPDTLLPLSKLSDYLGPDLTRQITALEPGKYSQPIESGSQLHILQLVRQQSDAVAPFNEVQTAVEAEYLRREGDKNLREYLAWLRQRTEIIVARENLD